MEIIVNKRYFLSLVIFALLFSSCKKEQVSNTANEPVVISYLMPGQVISVKVYQQKSITDTTTYGSLIGGLALTISDGSKTINLTETSTGTYTYSDLTYLTAGKTYTLKFNYQNTLVSASTLMPSKPLNFAASRIYFNMPYTLQGLINTIAVSFSWSNPDSLYHVLVFKNDNIAPFDIHPERNNPVNFSLNANQAASYDVGYSTFNYIGIYWAMLYSVNKEYINLLNSNANATSQQLANPPTNVNNGYGIFTAVQADTIRLTLVQY